MKTYCLFKLNPLIEGHDEKHAYGHDSGVNHENGSGEVEIQNAIVKPTWASPNPEKPEVYVAGNGNDKIYIIDTDNWEIDRVWDSSGQGPYNL